MDDLPEIRGVHGVYKVDRSTQDLLDLIRDSNTLHSTFSQLFILDHGHLNNI